MPYADYYFRDRCLRAFADAATASLDAFRYFCRHFADIDFLRQLPSIRRYFFLIRFAFDIFDAAFFAAATSFHQRLFADYRHATPAR